MGAAPSRKGHWLTPVAAILAVLAVGGGATFYLQNRGAATTPRTPREVARRFLDVALVTHEENGDAGYICDMNNLDIYGLRWKLTDIESQEDLTSKVSFHNWQTVEEDPDAHVTVRISIEFPDAPARDYDENWKLDLKHSDNWRVCTARRTAQPTR
jgi:hypothetical protein